MLGDRDRGFEIGGVWFNGHPQVLAAQVPGPDREIFGVAQADSLSKLVRELKIPWNEAFVGGPIHSGSSVPGLRVGEFAVRIVSPSQKKLAAMAGPWVTAWREAKSAANIDQRQGLELFGGQSLDVNGLAAADDEIDTSKPNGSSIGLIMEAFGRRLLLAADCHPEDLTTALAAPTGASLNVDVFKISHHGARKNTTNAMLRTIIASTYAFSTDGRRHEHPDDHSVAKVIACGKHEKVIAFNYRSPLTLKWNDDGLKGRFGYETRYPSRQSAGHLWIDLPGT